MSPSIVWQIGKPAAGVGVSRGTAEFIQTPWATEFDYHVGTDADPINQPHMPARLNIPGGPQRRGSTETLHIHFTLNRSYTAGELRLIYDRYGAEEDQVFLDGEWVERIQGGEEGQPQHHVIALGAVSDGPHVMTITTSGDTRDQGHAIDYLQLQAMALQPAERTLQTAPTPSEPSGVVSQRGNDIEPDVAEEQSSERGISKKERAMATPHATQNGGWTFDPKKVATQTVLVLGGGAPNSTLMAGALCAFEEKKVEFDIVYTSGAGALMGLLYVAPNSSNPYKALRDTVDLMGVADSIYRLFPVGYKTFFKPGPFTRPLHRWGQMFKMGQSHPRFWSGYIGRREDILKRWYNAWNDLWIRNQGNAFQRLYNDWIDLWLAAINPSDLNPFSKGMSASFPFLQEMVDFSKLELFPGQFYMNAYNITDQHMDIFNKRQIVQNPEVFRAALAMPFIYPPAEVNGKLYIEGADHDPISFGNLKTRRDNDYVKTIVVFDILSTLDDYIVREPRNVWDAYQISIMAPIVALAEKNIADFKEWVKEENAQRKQTYNPNDDRLDAKKELSYHILNFEIPKAQRDYLLDWSYSNLLNNWKIGYRTGLEFADYLGDILPKREEIEEPPRRDEQERLQKRFGKGPTFFPMIDLVGRTESDAMAIIRALDLPLVNRTVRPSDEHAGRAGRVLTQEPKAGTPIERGQAVSIEVVIPYEVTVPDVTRLNQQEATQALQNAGLTVGGITTSSGIGGEANLVVNQLPTAGRRVPRGTAVALEVGVEDDAPNVVL